MKKITAALVLTILAFCLATNVAFAETPTDIGEPPLAVEEALLSPPIPGETYDDEFIVRWYSPVEEDTTDHWIPSGPILEIMDDDFEDPQAPELVEDSEESTTNPAAAPHMDYVRTSEDFHPWEYVKALLRQGAQKNVSFVRDDDGKTYIRISVYLPIPEDYPEGMEYDGCDYVVVKNGVVYYLSPISIEWNQRIF